jgi:dienelactone hydrolase
MRHRTGRVPFARVLLMITWLAAATARAAEPTSGDRMIAAYFEGETRRLADASLAGVKSAADWSGRRAAARAELLEMLGLDPMPERTDLKATVTGTVDHAEFTVENLHFQSRPRLYVTANLYVPKGLTGPAPAVLYVCGHAEVKRDGVAYGNKVGYQHHAAWFARNGYVCLIIDTLQLGEIEGVHHGTYNKGMWWWNSRGYTPAGVEAWNCIRALDYLETRKEVDAQRIGVTGRSGGGAYSWWVTALDDRIKVSAPTAGITDLHNHVIDGTVEGHCDCMFMINTYRWDFPEVAALAAPRPLLIVNTDKDDIFPLDGVMRLYWKTRRLYDLFERPKLLGPVITEGGHVDTQEQQVATLQWFNRHLKGAEPLITNEAVKLFEPQQLRVFEELPADSINAAAHETFVPRAAPPAVPADAAAWATLRDGWMAALNDRVFRGWPTGVPPLDVKEVFAAEKEGLVLKAYDFTSQERVRLRLYVEHAAGLKAPAEVVLHVLDDQGWSEFVERMRPRFAAQVTGDAPSEEPLTPRGRQTLDEGAHALAVNKRVVAFIAPRGVGPTAFSPDERTQTQIRRRFVLLGQTLESMQVWDVRRAVQVLRSVGSPLAPAPLSLGGERQAAGLALYASLFEPDVAGLELRDLPASHRDGPHLLNVMRFLDTPQVVALAAERSRVRLHAAVPAPWAFAVDTAGQLGWPADRLKLLDNGE